MSYSFSLRAPSKADLAAAVAIELDKVVATQPIHEADRAAAAANIDAALAVVEEKDGFDLSLSANGWVQSDGTKITGVSIGASVSLIAAET